MSIRILKVVLVICVGLQAMLYALGNLFNLDGAFGAMAYVFSMVEHEYYPNPIVPPITWAPLVGVVLAVVIAAEATIGLLCFRGGLDMWKARRAEMASFADSRRFAILGCGLALVLWIGLFMAGGGALLQMWQTQLGSGSLEGAFMYALSSAVVLIFVNQPEHPPHA